MTTNLPTNLSNNLDDAVEPSMLVSVGDHSADRHVGKLLSKLKEFNPQLKVWGLGGSAMRERGAELLYDCSEFSSIGILGLVKMVPFFIGVRKKFIAEIARRKPKAVLLVDFGGFNIQLAKEIKKHFNQLPIYYFISPQVWGSRPWRIKAIAKTVSKMLVIFPFERELYKSHDVPVQFVGHPLIDNIQKLDSLAPKDDFCSQYKLDPHKPIIAVFSGSRKSEIRSHLPVILDAIRWMSAVKPEVQFALSCADEDLKTAIIEKVAGHKNKDLNKSLRIVAPEDNYNLMSCADLVWAKSGTTTLEATLFGKPMLIFYRGDWLSYFVFLAFKRVARVGWPNLLAGKPLVPELIQLDCRAEALVKYSLDLLNVPGLRKEITQELLSLRDQLGEGDYASLCADELNSAIISCKLITTT